MIMLQIFANQSSSLLAAPIASGDLSLTVTAGTGELFPQPAANQYFVATLNDAATGLLTEIIWATAVSGDVFTILRGEEGTTPLAWKAGDIIQCLVTAGTLTGLLQQSTIIGATNAIFPTALGGNTQSATGIWACTGLPNDVDGANNDYCFRSDGATGSRLYQKQSGTWTAIL